ncbi:hypothetical protein C8R43DRAFT_1142735 [Mycena crocata]|nr:hypothetical protein C8R43DRAFT_1142735 [Mycena crocata]
MTVLWAGLDLSNTRDFAIWSAACTAWRDCVRLGEILVDSPAKFDPARNVTRNCPKKRGHAANNHKFVSFKVPWTKTQKAAGDWLKSTETFDDVDTVSAFEHHLFVNLAVPDSAPLFAYTAQSGWAHLPRADFLGRCNEIWSAAGMGALNGHGFRIGGTTHLLLHGVDPWVVMKQVLNFIVFSHSITTQLSYNNRIMASDNAGVQGKTSPFISTGSGAPIQPHGRNGPDIIFSGEAMQILWNMEILPKERNNRRAERREAGEDNVSEDEADKLTPYVMVVPSSEISQPHEERETPLHGYLIPLAIYSLAKNKISPPLTLFLPASLEHIRLSNIKTVKHGTGESVKVTIIDVAEFPDEDTLEQARWFPTYNIFLTFIQSSRQLFKKNSTIFPIYMDEYYDTKEAAERVGKWGDILAAPENKDHTVTMVAANIDMRKISIQKRDFPLAWVAVALNADVLRAESDKERKERFAVQEVAIVGFDDDTFMRGITRVKDVVSRIAYNLPATGELDADSWLAPDEGKGMGPKAAFDKYIDPHSVLQRMETEGMAHFYENEVVYLQLDNGRLETKDPAGFMEGDVVKLGFFVQGFKKNSNDGVVRLVMRTLTLLDRDTSQKAGIARRQARKPIEHPIWTFNGMLTASNRVNRKKRTFHLSDSEDNKMPLTRRRMGDMNLQDTDMK